MIKTVLVLVNVRIQLHVSPNNIIVNVVDLSYLQEVGEGGVAVGHVLGLACERVDDLAEGGQRLVDVLSLLQPAASSLSSERV